MTKKYTITAALPYANGPLHIGHLAGAYISADIFARYLRQKGNDVIFICGSDEHGAAITIKAKKENQTPKAIVDKYHSLMRDSFEKFGIAFDIYHRTSDAIHYETSQDFFRVLNSKNAFDIHETEQYYDEEAKQFLADRYIIGTCPKCSNDKAYGDQCEKCGSTLSPTDLLHPTSTISGAKPVLRKTKHWFLKLDAQQNDIKNWLETKESIWKNHVIGQCKSWINDGLKPRSMTRDLDWGVPVPPEIKDAEGKVLYVWLDAPIGYISATKKLFQEIASKQYEYAYPNNFSEHLLNAKAEDWKAYWQDDNTSLIHFIGKDNIVFHCITFPAILKAHENYILPENVPANEFMNLEGDKISTSRNWAVWLHEYLQDFPNKEDELRYCLIANMPENKDSEFTWNDFQNRVNSELVANLGNFVNRVAVLTHKFYEGKVPQNIAVDAHIIDEIHQTKLNVDRLLNEFKFKEALSEIMRLSSFGNKFLQDNEPWKLIKTDEAKTMNVMYNSIYIVAELAYLLQAFLPKTSEKIAHILNFTKTKTQDIVFDENHVIGEAVLLFTKIENAEIEQQMEKLNASKNLENTVSKQDSAIEFAPQNEIIQYEDFSKMDIRSGTILQAEKVEKADKLLKLTVDIGYEQRTIVSGIAQHFSPEEIVGKKVLVLVNLAPRKLRGIESAGMILMAEDAHGKLHFVAADSLSENGRTVK